VPRIVGDVPSDAVERALRASAGRIASCNDGAAATVRVQFHYAFGHVGLAAPAPDNAGPRDVAQCVAQRIKPALPALGEDVGGSSSCR